MPTLSIQTLMIAITSTVAARCRLLDRIAIVDAATDADEHLSESVMDIDHALGELSSLYSQQTANERIYPACEQLIEQAVSIYSNNPKAPID